MDEEQERLTRGQLEELCSFDSATIANAIESFKVRHPCEGFTNMELRCYFPEYPPVAGYAVTFCEDTASPCVKGNPGDSLPYEMLYRAIEEAPKPSFVVIKNMGSDMLRSDHFGDLMATIFQKLGAVAFLTDGGVRDMEGVRVHAPGFQTFGRGAVPSHGVPRLVAVNVPVSVFGLTIRPGDLLHGDANGVVSIPLAVASQVAQKAREVAEHEEKVLELIGSSDFSVDRMLQAFPKMGL